MKKIQKYEKTRRAMRAPISDFNLKSSIIQLRQVF